MNEEIGELGINILQAVKNELDPAGILNPGKTFSALNGFRGTLL